MKKLVTLDYTRIIVAVSFTILITVNYIFLSSSQSFLSLLLVKKTFLFIVESTIMCRWVTFPFQSTKQITIGSHGLLKSVSSYYSLIKFILNN